MLFNHRHVCFLGCSLPKIHISFVITGSNWTKKKIKIWGQSKLTPHRKPQAFGKRTHNPLAVIANHCIMVSWPAHCDDTATWLPLPLGKIARPAGGKHRYGSDVGACRSATFSLSLRQNQHWVSPRCCLRSITLGQRTRPKQTAWWKNVFCHCWKHKILKHKNKPKKSKHSLWPGIWKPPRLIRVWRTRWAKKLCKLIKWPLLRPWVLHGRQCPIWMCNDAKWLVSNSIRVCQPPYQIMSCRDSAVGILHAASEAAEWLWTWRRKHQINFRIRNFQVCRDVFRHRDSHNSVEWHGRGISSLEGFF